MSLALDKKAKGKYDNSKVVMSWDFRSHYPGLSLPTSPCQKGLILVMCLLCLNDSMALAAIKHERSTL